MNVRDMINKLTAEYKRSLDFADGEASVEQQTVTLELLDSIRFYTIRLMLFGNNEIEGT